MPAYVDNVFSMEQAPDKTEEFFTELLQIEQQHRLFFAKENLLYGKSAQLRDYVELRPRDSQGPSLSFPRDLPNDIIAQVQALFYRIYE
jgi:hypothetical protein